MKEALLPNFWVWEKNNLGLSLRSTRNLTVESELFLHAAPSLIFGWSNSIGFIEISVTKSMSERKAWK